MEDEASEALHPNTDEGTRSHTFINMQQVLYSRVIEHSYGLRYERFKFIFFP